MSLYICLDIGLCLCVVVHLVSTFDSTLAPRYLAAVSI